MITNGKHTIKTLNIQLFGGPGTGKSTLASKLFSTLKEKGYETEYIQEYAKDLTYSKDYTKLNDQFLVGAEQHHRLRRLQEHNLDYIIHDSPFIMGLVYLKYDRFTPKDEYVSLLTSLYNSYNNLNIFLERNTNLDYENKGRNQILEEAIEKDKEILSLLDSLNIPYIKIKVQNLDTMSKDIIKLLF